MYLAALILILSTSLFFFYFQATCQKILRRRFSQEFFQSIVNANRLEFPSVRKAIEELGSPVEYPRLTVTLKCDFLALTYLLKNAANVNQRYSYEERLLILYFKVVFASLVTRHWLRLRETPAALKLTSILEYFANVVGERVNTVRFGNLTASDYLLNL
ncbi:MAG TPA: hypothetical protein VMO17_09840 [Terriglobia bacterium]|nr:hypothetical protein [Terriglobia bacterium]